MNTPQWIKPDYWDKGKRHLASGDHILKPVIEGYKDEQLRSRGDAFETLARAIVGQQISVKAADSIWNRLAETLGGVSVGNVLAAEESVLRGVGLSSQKVLYLTIIAESFAKKILVPESWGEKTDDAIIKELTAIKGIGRWTAEMFLIFHLMRPNVLPLDDVGLMKGISHNYFSGEPVSRHEMRELSQAWQPYCSVATWYLWRSLDPLPVAY